MPISVQILVVVRGPVGRTLASSNDSLEGILGLRLGTHRQLDRGAFRQGNRLLGLKCPLGIDGFDGDTHGSPLFKRLQAWIEFNVTPMIGFS